MPIDEGYVYCEWCGKPFKRYRVTGRFCSTKCRSASRNAKVRAKKEALRGMTAEEIARAESIRKVSERSYELIVLSRRTALTAARCTLWATWLQHYPDDQPPSDLLDALHRIGFADGEVARDPLLVED